MFYTGGHFTARPAISAHPRKLPLARCTMAAPNKIQFNGAGGLRIYISFTRIDGLVDRAHEGVSA
jgi:hypothetical protein